MAGTNQDFLFLDETSGAESNVMKVAEGSVDMTLQVESLGEDAISLVVQGRVDEQSEDNWQPICALDMTHIDAVTTIVAEGIYAIAVGGVREVRIVNNGTVGGVKAYCRILA